MDDGFERWVKAYGVTPANSPKRACELLGCGHDYFYKLVKLGKITIRKMGTKSVVTGENIYQVLRELPEADRAA
ncbi:hypothetical protein [Bradyrhizobium vignae]|uniref:hypothetical protein n=1 Tax=Bradyrhizobium vignae TaxID=1549949 RepID=UPI00100AF079|nr:hypothetical protein [Bradyrhizobium vignae]RXG92275.1 hypothetical protein EAV90_27205 [Bradyrhizobium vignae]